MMGTRKKTAKQVVAEVEVLPVVDRPRYEHMTVESPVTQIVARLAQYGAAGWHVVGMSGPTILLERTV